MRFALLPLVLVACSGSTSSDLLGASTPHDAGPSDAADAGLYVPPDAAGVTVVCATTQTLACTCPYSTWTNCYRSCASTGEGYGPCLWGTRPPLPDACDPACEAACDGYAICIQACACGVTIPADASTSSDAPSGPSVTPLGDAG